MGDADSDVVVPVRATYIKSELPTWRVILNVGIVAIVPQEIDTWMDEALEVVDEGLENLFTLMTYLSERTKSMMLELKCLESLRKVFIALNLFVVPVVIAIMLTYETRGIHYGIEAGFQIIVMCLMFVACSIGLPFYIYSIWDSFKTFKTAEEQLQDFRSICAENLSGASPIVATDSLLSLLSNESSLMRLNDFARMLSNRMPDSMRADLLRRRNTELELSESRPLPSLEESLETELEIPKFGDINPIESQEQKEDQYYDSSEPRPTETDFSVLYQFQVLMHDQSPDLAIKIEPANKPERKEISDETAELARNEFDPLSNNNEQNNVERGVIEEHLLSLGENSEEKGVDFASISTELHTCTKILSLDNQLQNEEISC
ncbi:uncharacterized protein TNCT_277891 [Trichonephila clavata]|uniref:Uncharacterized protein n=1 Tax=Trichonephila clavata TaxID=2740835 RepID=A0A8X6KUZ9_TRICU|nr:uncharacterized protein TNCT_277891 [Trichonephila clavata]